MLEKELFYLCPLETTCVLLHNGKEAVVFDPGGEPSEVVSFLQAKGLKLSTIFNTHLHFDHTYGNAALQKASGASIRANERDAYMLESELGSGGAYGLPKVQPYSFENFEAADVEILGSQCRVMATPGHSPGSLSFYFAAEKMLISGDVLFYRSVGRSDFPGGDAKLLTRTIRELLFALPDDTVVYPGHGEETSIGYEKANNFYVR